MDIRITNDQEVEVRVSSRAGKSTDPFVGTLAVSVVSGDASYRLDPENPGVVTLISGATAGDTVFHVSVTDGVHVLNDEITLSVSSANSLHLVAGKARLKVVPIPGARVVESPRLGTMLARRAAERAAKDAEALRASDAAKAAEVDRAAKNRSAESARSAAATAAARSAYESPLHNPPDPGEVAHRAAEAARAAVVRRASEDNASFAARQDEAARTARLSAGRVVPAPAKTDADRAAEARIAETERKAAATRRADEESARARKR